MPKQFDYARAGPAALPLSVAQAEVWVAQKLVPADTRFNIGGYVEISGTVDPEAFAAALRAAPPGTLTPWPEALREELEYRYSAGFHRDRSYWHERLSSPPDPATLSGRPPREVAEMLERAPGIRTDAR